jgi:chromosome segregation ATPase
MIADQEATARTLAAMAGELLAEAEAERGREAEQREGAGAILAEARAQAAAIIASAETAAGILSAEADQAGKTAAGLEQRGRWAGAAARGAEAAEEAEARAAALVAERDRCAARIAEVNGQLADLAGQRADAEARLDGARQRGDVDDITALRGRLDALADLAASVSAHRAQAQARIEAIGTGQFLPGERTPRELYRALTDASSHRSSVRQALNMLYPDRPEAELDRRRAEYQRELLPRPSDAPGTPEPRTFVPTYL